MRRFLVHVGLGTFFALAYVQQRVVLISEGYQVEKLRRLKDDLLDQHRVLHYNVFTLQSPVVLDQRLTQQDGQWTPPENVEILHPRILDLYAASPSQEGVLKEGPAPWLKKVRAVAAHWFWTGQQAEAEPAR
jgi:hypothetical protein